MTCNRCERLGEENSCDPKQFCKCGVSNAWEDKKVGFTEVKYGGHLKNDEDETARMVRTLTREPSESEIAFYDYISATIALKEIALILDQYRNKEREFITYEELQTICSKGLKK